MEFVMIQENVYAMIIGIQKQIALVRSKLDLALSILNSQFKIYILQSFCVEMMVIAMEMGHVWTPNVIVYLDGIHLLIVMVSTQCIKIYGITQGKQSEGTVD